jgi:hypothetical protein
MPERPTAEPKIENQEIVDNGLQLPFSLIPQSIRRWFVSNIFIRSFAQLLGWTGTSNVLIAATASGYIKTSVTGTVFEHQKVFQGNAPNAWGAALDLGRICPRLDTFIENNKVQIQLSIDDVVYSDIYDVPANFFYSIDSDVRYIKIQNKVPAAVGVYQFIGFY